MKRILITGATGNVGLEVIKSLAQIGADAQIYAGTRGSAQENEILSDYPVTPVLFDFLDAATVQDALSHCDVLFLLRPPQIADVGKYFAPLIQVANTCGVGHIVFLSVQGVEKSSIIPHHKIEKLIVDSGVPYTFLRPSYFMQNFTGNLREDLVRRQRIYLPAGRAKFTLIDAADIGRVAARVLLAPDEHLQRAYDLTGTEQMSFGEMAAQLSEILGQRIIFESPNLLRFFLQKRKEGVPTAFILVMVMLHYLPRFQSPAPLSDGVLRITGHTPQTFAQFIHRHREVLGGGAHPSYAPATP